MQLLLLPTLPDTAFFFGPICKNFLGFRKFSMLHEVESLPRLRGFVERGHYRSLLIVGPFLFISSLQFIHKINEQEKTNPLGTDNCGAKSRQLFMGVFVFVLVCFFFYQISAIKFQLNLSINRHPEDTQYSLGKYSKSQKIMDSKSLGSKKYCFSQQTTNMEQVMRVFLYKTEL